MNTTPTLPSYTDVSNALKKTPAKYSAAQVHGLICGLLCSSIPDQKSQWEALVLGDDKKNSDQELLLQLHEITFQQIAEFSFEFTLLLPPDSKPLETRVEALSLWCQGFLSGLSQAELENAQAKSLEVADALNDIIEIAQVNHDDILDENDEDETAYIELVEYVRLAVLMIFHELKSADSSKDSGETDLLH